MARFLPAWNTYQEQASSRTAEGAAIEPDLSAKTSAAVCSLGLATNRLAISLSLTMPLGTMISFRYLSRSTIISQKTGWCKGQAVGASMVTRAGIHPNSGGQSAFVRALFTPIFDNAE